jgi:class 3 adenylate cyclase/tetratricopeptide (TPR) repeat protein
MDFYEVLAQVTDLLQREERVSYRVLKRQFGLDDDYIEDLKDELIYAKRLALDEDGRVLVLSQEAKPSAPPATSLEDESPPAFPASKHVTKSPTSGDKAAEVQNYPRQGLTDKIPSQDDKIEGERRQATVLFSDLSGYTTMNERLDPEEVTGIMERFKSEAERIVATHGGSVNQFVGDEVFALFGIPTAYEDDPARAVRAALELHEAVRALGEEVEERLGDALRLHSGINTGLVVTSPGGDDARGGQFVVTGDTVNTAARLVSRADTDQIILGAATRRQVAPFFDLEELEPVAAKGKARPLVPYRVLGVSGVASRFEAAEARGFTPYTGREGELAALSEALERALAGEGQFFTVSGEAGLGKSRLLYEFRQAIDREAVVVVQGRCQSFGQSTPYLPLANALRRGLNLHEADDPAHLHDQAVANVLTIDRDLERYIPVFLHLLSISSTTHPLPETMQGESLRQACQDAIAAVNLATSRTQPMVLIFEDWHWADEASDAALRHLLTLIGTHRLMVVVNYRPEYDAGWQGTVNHQHVTLAPLSADHSAIIAKSVLAAHSLPEGLDGLIHQRTGGNPFFIEEMCLDLLEEGVVLVKDGQAALTRPAERLNLPGTVQAVIRSRLDRLDEAQQAVLRVASVIGREFDRRLLALALDVEGNAAGLDAHLKPLITQGLIQQVRVTPDAAYQFKHVLTQVVTYETLLHERRAELHRVIGEALENLYAQRQEEICEQLAYHFKHGGEAEKTVTYLEMSVSKAAKDFSFPVASTHCENAYGLLKGLARTPENIRRQAILALRWANINTRNANPIMLGVLEESLKEAREIQDSPLIVRLLRYLGNYKCRLGIKDASAHLEECLALAETLKDPRQIALATDAVARATFHEGQIEGSIPWFEKSISLLRDADHVVEYSFSLSYLALCHAQCGNFPQAEKHLNDSHETARMIDHAGCLLFSDYCRGKFEAFRGNWERAQIHFDRAYGPARNLGFIVQSAEMDAYMGLAAYRLGDAGRGISLMERGVRQFEPIGSVVWMHFAPLWYGRLAQLNAELGRWGEAETYLKHCMDLDFEWNTGRAFCEWARAWMAVGKAQGDWEVGLRHVEAAQALLFKQELRTEYAVGEFDYARYLHKKGDLEAAAEKLRYAITLFGEMGMTWWLGQGEALRGPIERGEPFRSFTTAGE